VETASKEKTAARSAHTPWLIAGAILLTTAGSLEWLMASAHGVSITSIHEHTIVPGVVHALAIVSVPVSLFPVFRKRPFEQTCVRVTAIVLIGGTILAGQALLVGFAAWSLSAGFAAWQHLSTRST